MVGPGLGVCRVQGLAVMRVLLHLDDDPIHDPHRLERVLASRRFGRQHHCVRAHRRSRLRRPRPRPGSASAPRSCSPASASRRSPACPPPGRRAGSGAGSSAPSPAPSRRRGRRAPPSPRRSGDDLVEPLDRRRLLELGHQRHRTAREFAHLVDVLRPLHEGQRRPNRRRAPARRRDRGGPSRSGPRPAARRRARSRPCARTASRRPPRAVRRDRRPASDLSRILPSSSSSCAAGRQAAKISGCGRGTRAALPGAGSRSSRNAGPDCSWTAARRRACRRAAWGPAGRPARRSAARPPARWPDDLVARAVLLVAAMAEIEAKHVRPGLEQSGDHLRAWSSRDRAWRQSWLGAVVA